MWVTEEIGVTPKEVYKHVAHGPWIPMKGTGKTYCKGCGLLNAKNAFTKWCVRKGCLNDLHPSYQAKRRLTSPNK